jgi:hypothetical protein
MRFLVVAAHDVGGPPLKNTGICPWLCSVIIIAHATMYVWMA